MMGMFDYIRYKGYEYQTKETPNQLLSNYKIEEDQDDGHQYLWLQEYDSEWINDESHILGMYENQSNHRWVRCDTFSGNIVFYRNVDINYREWIEYSAVFENGRVISISQKV